MWGLTLKSLAGESFSITTLDGTAATVMDLFNEYHRLGGMPPDQATFVSRGQTIEGDKRGEQLHLRTLWEVGVRDGDTLMVVLKLRGD